MSAADQPSSSYLPPTSTTTDAPTNAPTTTPTAITLRSPSTLPSTTSPTISPPPLSFLTGTWHVTHSTLPMWKSNKNVKITYTSVPNTSPVQLDDLVTYQSSSSTSASVKTVHGLDRPFSIPTSPDSPNTPSESSEAVASLGYNWRGKGLLFIASSKWEILGYGYEEGSGNAWVVTYFAKTLFTPVGLDFYSREGKLRAETVEGIKGALRGLGDEVGKLAEGVFEVGMDG